MTPEQMQQMMPKPNFPTQSAGGFTPQSMMQLRGGQSGADQASATLGHSTGIISRMINGVEGLLPTAGAIAGGIGGAALGGLAGIETGPGAIATGYAGGVAGSGAGAAAGEALEEKLQGQPLSGGDIATQGAMGAGAEAIGAPILSGAGKVLGGIARPVISTFGKGISKVGELLGGKPVAEAVPKIAESVGIKSTEDQSLTEALTPKFLKPTQKSKAILSGKVAPAGIKTPAGLDPIANSQIGDMVSAVKNVATALGQKATSIVKTGLGQGIRNVNRLDAAIKNYSQKIVRPFIQASGADYNFSDLRDAFSIVKPPQGLTGEALASYKRIGENLLQTIANKVGPEVKNIRNLADLRKATIDGSVPKKVLKGDEDFWDARKILDEVVQQETKGKAFGDAALQGAKAAYEDYRRSFAQYLSDAYRYPGQMEKVNRANSFLSSQRTLAMDKTGWHLPTFERMFGLTRNPNFDATANEWEGMMNNLSKLYDAKTTIGPAANQEFGKTWMQLFRKEHPVISSAAKYGAEAIGAGALYEGAKDVGISLP